MENKIVLTATGDLIKKLPFKAYRSTVERAVRRYEPMDGEPLSKEVKTPWGEMLRVDVGDYLVSELSAPEDTWPVEAEIFEQTYILTAPGRCVKKAVTYLVPLSMVTGGNEDKFVTVESLEGPVTVRAGDFYLAKGVKGEIWPIPNEKVGTLLVRLEG